MGSGGRLNAKPPTSRLYAYSVNVMARIHDGRSTARECTRNVLS